MDSVQSLLNGRMPSEPAEIVAIKKIVSEQYGITPKIAVRTGQIIIGVPSAALAGALRPQLLQLQEACGTTSRLILRIQ